MFSKSKTKEFRKSLHNIKIKEKNSAPEIKETKKNLAELEKSLYNLKKYYDYDDIKYYGIRDIGNLFGEVDEDYYKPIKTKSAFNGNYIEYQSKGDKDKHLQPEQYLNMMRQYLSDIINDDKTRIEWEIQLTMQINFISSKDFEETRTMYTKSHNIEIIIGNETDEIIKIFLNRFYKIIKKIQKNQ